MPLMRSTTARRLRPFPPNYRPPQGGTTVRLTAGPQESADRSGTVTASITISGTVAGSKSAPDAVSATTTVTAVIVGRKAAADTAAGTITITGTVAGAEGHSGAAAGSLTVTGTTSGAKAVSGLVAATVYSTGIISGAEHHFGQVTTEITSTATVVGTKDDPQPPAPVVEGSGGRRSFLRRLFGNTANTAHSEPARPRLVAPKPQHRGGTVQAASTSTASVRGRCSKAATTRPDPRQTHGAAHGSAARHATMRAATSLISLVDGWGITNERIAARRREEVELLVLVGMETP